MLSEKCEVRKPEHPQTKRRWFSYRSRGRLLPEAGADCPRRATRRL